MSFFNNTVVLAIIVFVISYADGASRSDLIVQTELGLVRGVRATDGDYDMYMGIRFAEIDGTNPFGPSRPASQYEGIFEANDDSAICPQIEEFNNTIVGSLDCLHLNVYVPPSASSTNRAPVLVWIYGGGFSIGFAGRYLYGPKFFIQQDIILVTVNYRVGPYGFMCLDIPEVPGNQGLKDQRLALKWIQANIEAFGGDRTRITIMGESAGGMSVDLHLFYDDEIKLYDKVIIQSGTSFTPAFPHPNRNAPQQIAHHLGFSTSDIRQALSFLATVDTNSVIDAVHTINLRNAFWPCIEREFDDVENFMAKNWLYLNVPKVKDMPILIGYNDDESLVSYASGIQDQNFMNRILSNGFDNQNEKFNEMLDSVRHFYFGDANFTNDMRRAATDFSSDFSFVHPTHRSTDRFIENEAGNIYFYVFSYVGERNFVKQRLNVTFGGAAHADEMGYLFDISYMDDPIPEDQLAIDRITTMWANFVKYGDPTPNTSELLPVKWVPNTNSSTLNYLDIGAELAHRNRPFRERMAFWDLFYDTYRHVKHLYPNSHL